MIPLILLPFLLLFSSCFSLKIVSASVDDPELCTRLTTAGQDEIAALPGLTFQPNFKHYSGFLKTTSKHYFHYWFFGLTEAPDMGPYLINSDGKSLRQNPHSWNKNASIVYIESPDGVGFSHSVDGGEPDASNDDSTAAQNYEAVKQFFNKFPLFRVNPTFITGESYAGVYVPMLVAKIVDGQTQFPINLEGMAIGNGYMNAPLDTDTLARFAYGHGLVEEKEWQQIKKECCQGCLDTCDLGTQYGNCRQMVAKIVHFCWRGGLNVYDLYQNCAPHSSKLDIIRRGIYRTKSLHSNETILWASDNANEFEGFENANGDKMQHLLRCLDGRPLVDYLNIPQVREALHIPTTVTAWDQCSDRVSRKYRVQYSKRQAIRVNKKQFAFVADMSHFVWKALWANVRVLLFYGDTDMACNFMLGQRFSEMLGLKRLSAKKPWHFDGQIAGFKTAYANGFTFITVRGSGHMVPQRRPAEIEYAFGHFLANRTI
uniref:Carboxypeptidase n=1 Tax=Globodera pallida TaxID=36090 RepID=A0A183CAW5_GLOPA